MSVEKKMASRIWELPVVKSGLFILSVLILLWPALINGYPLVLADSGTYLLMGHQNQVPVDRPLTYPLFIGWASMGLTAWFSIVIQAVIITWMLRLTLRTFFPGHPVNVLMMTLVTFLGAATGLAVLSSQIMPDIYLALALLGFFNMLFGGPYSKTSWIGLMITTLLSSVMHMSALPVVTGILLLLAAAALIRERDWKIFARKKILVASTVLLAAWLVIPTINLLHHEGFRFSRSSSVIFFSRLLIAGSAQQYIKDHCEKDPANKFCKFADGIDEYDYFDEFLWEEGSFLYDDEACEGLPWDDCWTARNEEFKQLNREILAYRPSLRTYTRAVACDFVKQTGWFRLKHYPSYRDNSQILYPLSLYYAFDQEAFVNARQQENGLDFKGLSNIQFIVVLWSLLFIFWMMIWKLSDPVFLKKSWILLGMVLTGILASSLLTATLAVITGRFTGRLIWLLPMLALILFYQFYHEKIGRKAASRNISS